MEGARVVGVITFIWVVTVFTALGAVYAADVLKFVNISLLLNYAESTARDRRRILCVLQR
jgi:hypothetical protein